jgi:microcystin degradation protein MlrC
MPAYPSDAPAKPRVLVGGVWHETNSFSPVATDLDAFRTPVPPPPMVMVN